MSNSFENLKAGDLVIVCSRSCQRVCKVEKITPSGLIKADGILFYKSGSERGGDTWNRCYLRVATPQLVQEIQDNATIQKAFKLMRSIPKITLIQAKKIIEILEKNEELTNQKTI